MTASSIRTPHACLERAVQFKQDAEQLLDISNQWYAVSYFYAAYHAVRASLMVDPIFNDGERLGAVNSNWLPEDRYNDHHQARRGNGIVGAPGVSDMVKELYPAIRVDYSLLHSASIAVRYGLGLSAYEPQAIKDAYETVAQAAISGGLVAA